MHQGMPLPSVACRAWRPGADPVNEGGCTSALLVEVGDGVGSSELASACSVSGCFGSPYLWVAGSWLSENSEFARLSAGGNRIRTFGTALTKGSLGCCRTECRTDKLDGSLSTGRLPRRRWLGAGPLSTAVSLAAGPTVRIRLPPAASLRTFGS